MQISSSGAITTTGVISGSNALSASYAATASFVTTAQTASFVTLAQTASFVANAQSASNAVTAQTASFANAFTVAGTLTAQTLVVQTITSSVDYVTGSTRFGSLLANTHTFTGSVNITGSLAVSGGNFQISDNSGSFSGFSFNTITGLTQTNNNKFTLQGALRVNSTAGEVSYISGSNVGIGTTSPSAQLHINSGGSYTNTDPNNRLIIERNNHAYILFSSPIEYDNGLHFHNTTDNTLVGRIAYFHRATGDSLTFSVDSSIRMTINSSGNVGIGTTNPSNTLDVNGSIRGFATDARIYSYSTTGGSYAGLTANSADGNGGFHLLTPTTGSTSHVTTVSNFDTYLSTRSTNNLILATANTERIRITSGGNIGIGTTSPATKLDIAGDLTVGTGETSNTDIRILNATNGKTHYIFSDQTSGELGIESGASVGIKFNTNTSNTRMVIASGGNVGIGTTNPLVRLHVGDGSQSAINGASNKIHIATTGTRSALLTLANSSGGTTVEGQFESSAETGDLRIIIGSTSNHPVVFRANNAEAMRIKTSGEVGVGVTPVTISSDWKAAQVGNLTLMGPQPGTDKNGIIGANAYYNGGWKRIIASYANYVELNQGSGNVQFYTGGTGAADSLIGATPGPYIANGGVSWTNGSSDIRKKKNFETTPGLAEVLQIEPIKYHFNWEEDDKPKRLGFKAQNIQSLIPEMVLETDEIAEDGSHYLTVTPDYILPVLVKAIQELKAENDTLKEILQRNNIQ